MSAAGDPFELIASYYDARVQQFGYGHEACDYGRTESQQSKFRVLSEVLPLTGCSLLDVGCGFADFAEFVEARGAPTRYVGIDLSAGMIRGARARRPDLQLLHGNILETEVDRADVVVANGVFYLLGTEAPMLMRQIIERMFSIARRAVAFNSLSSWSPDRQENEFHADPLATLRYCRELAPRIVLRHDYHPRDFTIYLYKEDA
jgi:SAM-dependent methyltransferase